MRGAGTATLSLASGRHEELAIRDLSTTGARLVGEARLVEGERVRVSLRLETGIVLVVAEVVRVEAQRSQVAIAFRVAPKEAVRAIERALETMIARAPSSVIVCHAQSEIRERLERDLAQLERATLGCTTLLETMWALGDRAARHAAIIIDAATEADRMTALLDHLAEHHPTVRRVVLVAEPGEPIDRDRPARVDAVLATPWQLPALANAVGIAG